ncbi:MAG: single-stranded DNA-binding protein [Bacteroidales bacterium]|nr:single-stranded DNA-binding protein [Bacteroidales bacterium]
MIGVNKVILIGNLGKDPEIISFDDVKKASFSLATTETHKTRDGQKIEETEWHNVICWRGLAEVAEKFLRKGTHLYVEGKIKSRIREDKEGNRKRVVEIVAENFKILNRSHSHQSSNTDDNNTDLLYDTLIEENYPLSENDMNLSKILAEDTELSKLGDLPF